MTAPAVSPSTLGRRAEQVLDRLGGAHRSLFVEGTWWTAAELAARGRRAARGFADLGVRPGDRVVICAANVPEVGIAYAALWRAGAVATPVLFLLSDDELRHVAQDSGAVAFVTTPELLPKVHGAAGGRPVVVVGGDGTAGPGVVPWEQLEAGEERPLADRDPADLAALLYTGGTTGRSKGVALSHANLDAAGAAGFAARYEPGRTRGLVPLPLAHVYGLMVTCTGLHAVEPTQSVLMRWFDPAGFVALVEEHRVQQAALVPSMIGMLLGQPLEEHDLSCLERVSSGGAPLAVELAVELERRVPGLEVREGYGCTETSGLIATQPVRERRLGSVGRPVAGTEVRIEDADGRALPPGEDGEICVRGPLVMTGYWRAEAETAVALREGWLHNGDVGHRDAEGYLYLVDRIKDVIIRGGFNVYPRDVEEALLRHPDVESCAVVGRPDERLGEEVVAFVALRPGAATTAEDLVGYGKAHLSAAKYPRDVRILPQVPVTSIGKTDRKALRKLLAG